MGNASFALDKIHELKTNFIFGFDLHGVLDTAPKDYKHILQVLRSKGHKVYVISGPETGQIIEELRALDLTICPLFTCDTLLRDTDGMHPIDGVYSVVDFLKAKKVKMKQDENGNWWAGDIDWWSAKAQICRTLGVDYMFDDTYTYKQFFHGTHTKFIHMTR